MLGDKDGIKVGTSIRRNQTLDRICNNVLPYTGRGSGIKRVIVLLVQINKYLKRVHLAISNQMEQNNIFIEQEVKFVKLVL